MEWNRDVLIDSYEFFASQLYQKNTYLIESKSEEVADKFVQQLSKKYHISSLGEDFLWNYLTFQFTYWDGVTLKSFDRKMKFSFIFGKKACERFLERDSDFDWQYLNNKIATICSKNDFRKLIKTKEVEEAFDSEAIYRRRFLNKEDGLSHCLLYTSLFNPLDPCCQICNNTKDCKELLRMNYPNIHRERIK